MLEENAADSLADIAILLYIYAFKDVRPELMETLKHTREWFERVTARPAVRATYPRSEEAPAPPVRR